MEKLKEAAFVLCIGMIVGLLVIGCVSYPRVIESSHNKPPSWTTDVPKGKDTVYFVGRKSEARRQEDGITDGRMDAFGQAANSIQARILSIYERARIEVGVDDSNYGNAIKDGLIARSTAVVRGAMADKIYWEHIEDKKGDEVKRFYHVAVLVSIPKDELRKAMNDELERQKPKMTEGDKEAEKFLHKLEQEFEKESFD